MQELRNEFIKEYKRLESIDYHAHESYEDYYNVVVDDLYDPRELVSWIFMIKRTIEEIENPIEEDFIEEDYLLANQLVTIG